MRRLASTCGARAWFGGDCCWEALPACCSALQPPALLLCAQDGVTNLLDQHRLVQSAIYMCFCWAPVAFLQHINMLQEDETVLLSRSLKYEM